MTTADNLRSLSVPVMDDASATERVVNSVVNQMTDVVNSLRELATVNAVAAPKSADHVDRMANCLSGTILDWLEAWPS